MTTRLFNVKITSESKVLGGIEDQSGTLNFFSPCSISHAGQAQISKLNVVGSSSQPDYRPPLKKSLKNNFLEIFSEAMALS